MNEKPATTTMVREPDEAVPAGARRGEVEEAAESRPVERTGPAPTTADIAATRTMKPAAETPAAPLFDKPATSELRDRWDGIQGGFVDEPRTSVEEADKLVAEVMKRLADGFASERSSLERQWSRGDDVSTEDLRLALRRYRSFFDRLLSV